MSDFKSKLPDFKEVTSMASKLFRDIKNSVSGIIEEYKQKHPPADPAQPTATTERQETTQTTTVVSEEVTGKGKTDPKVAKVKKTTTVKSATTPRDEKPKKTDL